MGVFVVLMYREVVCLRSCARRLAGALLAVKGTFPPRVFSPSNSILISTLNFGSSLLLSAIFAPITAFALWESLVRIVNVICVKSSDELARKPAIFFLSKGRTIHIVVEQRDSQRILECLPLATVFMTSNHFNLNYYLIGGEIGV